MPIYDWFAGLATIGGFLYFLAGFGAAYALSCVRAKLRHKTIKIPWQLAGIAIGVCAIIITTFQSSGAYNQSRQTAAAVQSCQREFNEALRARSQITSENDSLSQEQRGILFVWIHDLLFPPKPFSDMDTADPRRQAYALQRTFETEASFEASIARQNAILGQRAQHPLPDLACGE